MAITYAPTTNFGLKDSLPTNDSDKVIRGSEFTTEFTAIQTAFSLAAPNASPTFTGTVTIPTADINGGAIDGTTIGGTTPAAASFTTVSATGNITVGGTVDGRDVAADGTKLDGIEAGADVTDTANVTAAGALMDSELTNIAAVKALNQGVATTDSPSFAGLTATTADINSGTIDGATLGGSSQVTITDADMNGGTIDGVVIGGASAAAGTFTNLTASGTVSFSGATVSDGGTVTTVNIDGGNIDGTIIGAASPAAGTFTTVTGTGFASTGDMTFGDNDKAIFGAGSDLQIYHDGSNSYIDDAGTGLLRLRSNTIYLEKYTGELLADFNADGYVSLLHDNSEKFRTTSTGIDVTGTVTADGLTVGATERIYLDGGSNTYIQESAADDLRFFVGGSQAVRVRISGTDILGTVTADGLTVDAGGTLRLDASATNDFFTITQGGTQAVLTADSDAAANMLFRTASAGVDKDRMQILSNGDIEFYEDTGTTPKFFWDASAEALGIGTTTPSVSLDVVGTTTSGLRLRSDSTASNGFNIYNDSVSDLAYLMNYYNGSMIFGVNNTEKMRLTSTGLGIGTSSPSGNLEIATSAADTGVDLVLDGNKTSNGGIGSIIFNNNGDSVGMIRSNRASANDAADMLFYTQATGGANTERMRITSAGNVGIGTNDPASYSFNAGIETVIKGTPNSQLSLISDTTGIGYLAFGDGTTGTDRYSGLLEYYHSDDSLRMRTAGSERMRIDSSGNLLVGTTNTAPATNNVKGIALRNEGHINVSRDSGVVGYFNRKTDDGTILDFRKDGVQVGSIGASSGDLYIGTGDTTLLFVDGVDLVIPTGSGGATRDAAISLGNASNRFKDLYLSGGVYLGGTGAANLLDDYEEGTWTGKVADAASAGNESSSNVNGYYVKIGQLVYVHFNVSNINTTGLTAGNDVYITGLPFTSKSVTGNAKYTGTAHMSAVTFSDTPILNVEESATAISVAEIRSGLGVDLVVVSQLSSGASDIHGNLCYQTD